jgi:hypothetical protein
MNDTTAQVTVGSKWEGYLFFNETKKMKIAFEIDKDSKGKFHSIEQDTYDLEISDLVFDEEKINFQLKSLNAQFSGKIHNNEISGYITLSKNSFKTELNKCNTFSFKKNSRPQEETIGGNYSVEDFKVYNSNSNINLSGVLTLPNNATDFPTIVFITGSGPNDKDHSIFGHKNFLVLSDLLAKSGIASLRLDDRGVGNSEGNFSKATVYDLAEDISSGAK